ncbi:acyl carrier protein [Nocardioides montaniterrae]
MSDQPTDDRLAALIGEVVGRPADEIGPGQVLGEIGVDSLAMIEVLLGIEQAFAVRVEDDDVAALSTYDALAAYVGQRVAQTT